MTRGGDVLIQGAGAGLGLQQGSALRRRGGDGAAPNAPATEFHGHIGRKQQQDGQPRLGRADTSGGNTLTGYKLFRAKSYNDFTQLGGTFSTTDTGHTDNGTSWDRAHEYRLIAIYSGNRESEPARVTIRTPRQPPWKVSGLTVTTDGATVTLTWDREGSGRATGYKVFRKSAHGAEAIDQYTKIADVSGRDTTTYQDDTVTSGQDYAYRVVATNNGQDGPPIRQRGRHRRSSAITA